MAVPNLGIRIVLPRRLCVQPLHLAAKTGREGAIRKLLEAGASPVAKARNGLTPIQVATQARRNAALELLTAKANDAAGQ